MARFSKTQDEYDRSQAPWLHRFFDWSGCLIVLVSAVVAGYLAHRFALGWSGLGYVAALIVGFCVIWGVVSWALSMAFGLLIAAVAAVLGVRPDD